MVERERPPAAVKELKKLPMMFIRELLAELPSRDFSQRHRDRESDNGNNEGILDEGEDEFPLGDRDTGETCGSVPYWYDIILSLSNIINTVHFAQDVAVT